MAQGTPVKVKKKKKSVLKNIRQTETRKAINRANQTRVRRAIRNLRAALSQGDAAEAEKLLAPTFSAIDRAIQHKVLHRNTADRYKSRLALAFNSVAAKKA